MADFADLARLAGRSSPLPRFASSLVPEQAAAYGSEEITPQPISAFVCIIDYAGETRPITCRRYELIGQVGYVGAICHVARGYRQFRCDRIDAVFDATTGEQIGDGGYFSRFAVEHRRDKAPTWGLTPSRKATLVAGLNVLAFMARCDGHWHPLESSIIEKFICSMWLRKEWEGDPAIDEIVSHAENLAPDSKIFFSALQHYAQSQTSSRILLQAIADLIAADGVICVDEMHWGAEVDAFFREYSDELFQQHFGFGVRLTLAG